MVVDVMMGREECEAAVDPSERREWGATFDQQVYVRLGGQSGGKMNPDKTYQSNQKARFPTHIPSELLSVRGQDELRVTLNGPLVDDIMNLEQKNSRETKQNAPERERSPMTEVPDVSHRIDTSHDSFNTTIGMSSALDKGCNDGECID
jgi:hypothetical protein